MDELQTIIDELEGLTRKREEGSVEERQGLTEAEQDRIDALVQAIRPAIAVRRDDIVAGAKLVRVIGKGNFGVVWQASAVATGRSCAVKLFDPDRLGLGLSLYHFRRGVRAMLHLLHAHDRPRTIIELYETDKGALAYSMEYLEGKDLANVSRRGWSLEKKLSVVETIAQATEFAHRSGILHRDIKPANIVMSSDGHPVLTDFDIADLLFVKTLSAQASGTVSYAAPEQLAGRSRRDPTCDVYSLGRVLHYLLIERDPPIRFEPTPLLEDLENFPRGLTQIIRKCTMLDPARRYPDVRAFIADLKAFEEVGRVGLELVPSAAATTLDGQMYKLLFEAKHLGRLFDIWGIHPTPHEVLSSSSFDELLKNQVKIDRDTKSKGSITWGGPPFRLGQDAYEEACNSFLALRSEMSMLASTHNEVRRSTTFEKTQETSSHITSTNLPVKPMSINPLTLLREAVAAVPAVRYALGVAGVASIAAIVSALRLDYRVSIIGTVLVFVLMTVLVIFARASTLVPKSLHAPALVLVYASLFLLVGTAFLLFSSVFFKWPLDLQFWLLTPRAG